MKRLAQKSRFDKSVVKIQKLVDVLCQRVQQAARNGNHLYEFEKEVLARMLAISKAALDAFLQLQGDGDLGPSVTSDSGETLQRSKQAQLRRLRTIFGEHTFRQHVYSIGRKQKIAWRPINARLGLSNRVCSYLLEEFSQLFCIESEFGQAVAHLETVFGQRLSVNTLETISQALGGDAKAMLHFRALHQADSWDNFHSHRRHESRHLHPLAHIVDQNYHSVAC